MVLGLSGLVVAGIVSAVLLGLIAMAAAYPNLPDISDLQDYRPKLPLRVFSAEGVLIGEFGEERRRLTPIHEIPQMMKDAVLAIEDARFYSHSGVDYRGLVRAALANLWKVKSQGASTITMQVARNAYLSSEKTYTRKLYEVLLTFKLEHSLSKDQILEIYMNQIFLGNRAYGFAAAAETYFGKPLREVTLAQAAMLAGLPKAPSAYNPIHNPKRARARQLYILDRMLENGFITPSEASEAKREPLQVVTHTGHTELHAEYLAETVRQLMYARYGEETYTRGLNVFTTLHAADQIAAYRALRRGIMVYERRQHYRGPEGFVDLPQDPEALDDTIDDALLEYPDNDEVLSAVVLDATPRKVQVIRRNGELLDITGDGLKPVRSGLSPRAADRIRIRRGAIVRIVRNAKGYWELTQLPEVEGALVAMDPRDGEVRAMVGGFDFAKSKFNHVTQAWRQPGSSFKPFIYSAALEHGITPATVIQDGPLFFDAGTTGSAPWEPKNYDGQFEGPMTLRRALARSKNMVSIRVLQVVGPKEAQQWITRFGFDADKHPPYLTMALGAGSVTPMQMAVAYSVFANGGHLVQPWIIRAVTDHKGKVLSRVGPVSLGEATRVIDERNAFVMNSLLQEVTRSGTAASAQAMLRRPDLYGKTGTTNDSMDAWFAGFHPTMTAVTWIGYDAPRNLGSRETGGGLSLPVWIEFMAHALQNVPVVEMEAPEGIVYSGGEWFYEEYSRSTGVTTLGVEGALPDDAQIVPPAPEEEKKQILDLFQIH
nr:penicillin-binding protein 1A [Candidatus Symbiobacter mobilis]